MLKTLGLRAGITIKIIPKIKRMPRECVTMLTLTEQRKPLISNIVLIQSPKREPLVSNIVLIQSPKREPLLSNIVILLRKKAAVRVCLALNLDNICAQKRAKYALGEPKLDVKDMYVKEILSHLLQMLRLGL